MYRHLARTTLVMTSLEFDGVSRDFATPDGRLYAAWGAHQVWGRAIVEGGRARFQMQPPPLEGDLKLYAGGGTPMLVMQELWGTFIVNLTPQR